MPTPEVGEMRVPARRRRCHYGGGRSGRGPDSASIAPLNVFVRLHPRDDIDALDTPESAAPAIRSLNIPAGWRVGFHYVLDWRFVAVRYRFKVKTWNEHHVGAWQDVSESYDVRTDEDIDRAVMGGIDTLFAESKVLALRLTDGNDRHIPVHAMEWIDIETDESAGRESAGSDIAASSVHRQDMPAGRSGEAAREPGPEPEAVQAGQFGGSPVGMSSR